MSFIQLTNTSDTTPVEVHVQIYQSTGDASSVSNTTRCIEGDFNDTLTPNDTVVYDLEGLFLNAGEIPTPAPIPTVDGTKGFVVVTPVVGNGDNTAISFQHLIGTTIVAQNALAPVGLFGIVAMGRDAVDLSTGQILPDGVTLDGITTGFVMVQPNELSFQSTGTPGADNIDVVAIVFADEYGPPGLLGYRAVPGSSTWTPFAYNFEEVPASCPDAVNACFNNWGYSAQFPAQNQLIDPGINICNAVNFPAGSLGLFSNWARIFITGLDPNENQFGVFNGTTAPMISLGVADWMNSK